MSNRKIFISYCWDNEEEANIIDDYFSKNGIKLIRDKRDLNYTESINEFMKRIRECEFYILVLSISYFQSTNCMKEFFEALKEKDFKEKVLPIVIENNFYSNDVSIKILNYWIKKEEVEKEKLKEVDPILGNKLYKELNEIAKIKIEIVDNIINLQKMLLTTFEVERKNNFKTLLNKIGKVQLKKEDEINLLENINIPNLKEITNQDKEKFCKENFIKMFDLFNESFIKIKEKNSNFNYLIDEKQDIKIIEIRVNDEVLKKMAFWIGGFISFDNKKDKISYKILNKYETKVTKNAINGQIICEVNSITKELELKDSMSIHRNVNENTIKQITLNILKNNFLNELENYSNRVRF